MEGRVIRVSGLQHLVEIEGAYWQCEIRGRLKDGSRVASSPVVVGDRVVVLPTGENVGVIETVQPRFTKFSRRASGSRPFEQIVAVNIDQLVVVASILEPAFRPGFIDRAVVMGIKGGLEPVICINKIDLDVKGARFSLGDLYRDLGYAVAYTSARTGEGVGEAKKLLQNRVSVVIGQSGVGKSSLLNCIEPGLAIKTQELMKQHDRGRHTTTAVQLYPLREGGKVADTPGVKELWLWGIEAEELVEYFVEMAPLVRECRFRDCSHLREPGCAVRQAVEQGGIATLRYEGFCRILESL